ncbi:MAG: 16S rRNA (adenine(1518)-N(6)/adenine(1519)-N(6))-dimethyltransferase RsmA [Candidatus Micrarchaeales archaeon]
MAIHSIGNKKCILVLGRTQVYLRPLKSLGQNFLVNRSVAEAEAEHAAGKNVLELGPGYGMLTEELCRKAKRVVAVEIDRNLFTMLKHDMHEKNLALINNDFFKAGKSELKLDDTDIMIANVPYKLSSKVIDFLLDHKLEAVLCLQKEFVEHMLAKPGTRNYSRLSVMFQLCFTYTKMMAVSKGSFRPVPKVDSVVVYIKPKSALLSFKEKMAINAIMQHKKKTVRNAILDSRSQLGMDMKQLVQLAESIKEKKSRVFKLAPEEILGIARELINAMSSAAPVSAPV